MNEGKFKPGDVVKLKSDFYGNHAMTVDHQDGNHIYYHCEIAKKPK